MNAALNHQAAPFLGPTSEGQRCLEIIAGNILCVSHI